MRFHIIHAAVAGSLVLAGAAAFAQADGPASPAVPISWAPDTRSMGAAPAISRQEHRARIAEEIREADRQPHVYSGSDAGIRLSEEFPGSVHTRSDPALTRAQVSRETMDQAPGQAQARWRAAPFNFPY